MTFADWQDVGIFPLQDHEEGVPIGMRKQLVGGRIVRLGDPANGGDAQSGNLEYGRVAGLGTLGDIHPWLFWQCASRHDRDTGSWAMVYAATSTDGSSPTHPTTGGSSGDGKSPFQPIRNSLWNSDQRYMGKPLGWPAGFPWTPLGYMGIVLPATEEAAQDELLLAGDPRLFAPNVNGPGKVGTLVCDLQPDNEPCMDGSEEPGVGGRHARLQSLVRVIALEQQGGGLFNTFGNGLALQYAASQQESLAGYGMVWGQMVGAVLSGPTTGGNGQGPITGPHDVVLDPGMPRSFDGSSQPPSLGGTQQLRFTGPQLPGVGKGPADYGTFRAAPHGGEGVACMAHIKTWGPIHLGSTEDKHNLGKDKDGNPINAAHVSTDAYFFRDSNDDGPLLFEGIYPNPPPLPLKSRVHLTWDGTIQHQFADGPRAGMWRWYAEVPFVAPTGTPTTPPPNIPTRNPTTPGNPVPGQPGSPGGPGVPGGPTTGPPAGPRAPGPGGPSAPGGGGSTGGSPGGGGAPGHPITPNPANPFVPGGRRFPGYPLTGGPSGPTIDPPTGPYPGGPGRGGNPTTGGSNGPTIDPPTGPYPGGPDGSGGLPWWLQPPNPPPFGGTPVGDDPYWRQGPGHTFGHVDQVGQLQPDSIGAYLIHHPLMESFGALSFRPQRWVAGLPNWEHGPDLAGIDIETEELSRPQSLAMRAWGAQQGATWDYLDSPEQSRARGGIVNGGIVFTPPQFEMEDYFQIGSQQNVATPFSSSFVMAAPGVVFALGTPNLDGGLNAAGVTIAKVADALVIAQSSSARIAMPLVTGKIDQTTSETSVVIGGTQALTIPRGTTAQRTTAVVGGEIRVNRSGAVDVVEFYDLQSALWRPLNGGQTYVVEGVDPGTGVVSIDLAIGGGSPLVPDGTGIPVAEAMLTGTVAVSWMSGTAPSGDAVVTLLRRPVGGTSFSAVATFNAHTS